MNFNNTPIVGCTGCQTTGGRLSCATHGNYNIYYGVQHKDNVPYCPIHGEITCDRCNEEIAREVDRINYKNL